MDTGSIILTSFLSTIPVYLFFATGFYLRHKQVIQADHDAPSCASRWMWPIPASSSTAS